MPIDPGTATLAAAGINTIGGILSNRSNRRQQERFAKQGIQWKVEDAKKAGIHPLYALGASTHQPSFAMQNPAAPAADAIGKYAAIRAKQDTDLDVENKKLQNDFIREQIESSKAARAKLRINAVQDSLIDQPETTQIKKSGSSSVYINPDASTEIAEQEVGEIGAILHSLRKMGRKMKSNVYNKSDKYNSDYVMDTRTGRFIKNPYKSKKRKTKRGYR